MRNIPKFVLVGGRKIAVRVDHEISDWGQFDTDVPEIRLSPRAVSKASTLRETLRHEMLHAALDVAGLTYLKHYEEESIVRCIDGIFMPAWEAVRKQLQP